MAVVQKHEKTVIRRRQIVEAARKLIIDRGSEHVTVRKLADAVGLSEGAIYRHFKSKRDILSFLVDHIEDSLLSDVREARDETISPLEALDRLLSGHLSAVEQRRGISFQVIAEIISLGDKKLNIRAFDAINKYVACLEELLAAGIKSGEIREGVDINAAATLFYGMVQGLVSIWALSNHGFNLHDKYRPLWQLYRSSVARHEGQPQPE
jgi:AcrR family transcriptional regulator